MKITIYQKPTCTTCRQVYKALVDAGVDIESVNYYTEPLSKTHIKKLLVKMNLRARDILRTKEPVYKDLKLSEMNLTEEEMIEFIVKYPDLLQRPIVEKGRSAILARPAERIKEFLS
jgi:arsenate reductase